jgi:hypothetical protein
MWHGLRKNNAEALSTPGCKEIRRSKIAAVLNSDRRLLAQV